MIGSFMSFAGYALVLFVLSIWMVVRIWKKSPLLAILCFFFWPLSIVALFTNWGDEESDIRIPFFLSVVVAGLMVFMAMRTVEKGVAEMAYNLTDEDIAQIRAQDPEMAQMLLEARDEQVAAMGLDSGEYEGDDDEGDETYLGGGPASTDVERSDGSVEPRPPAAPRDPAVVDAEHRANVERSAGNIAWQFRRIALPATNGALRLPGHFRFAPRANLLHFARLRAVPLPADVAGWAVHRDVNLAREDAWYVQVRHVPQTRAPALPQAFDDAAARAAAQADFVGQLAATLGSDGSAVHAPTWDAATGIATWQRGGTDPAAAPYADFVAVRIVPGGLVECMVPNLHLAKAELGMRAARLVATGVEAAAGGATPAATH